LAEWYYIGHYGQLGPLTREQIDELVDGGVIERETYVWHSGMSDWKPAIQVDALKTLLQGTDFSTPPPPPMRNMPSAPQAASPVAYQSPAPSTGTDFFPNPYASYQPVYATIPSDRNRLVAGLLQLLIPGVGRMYLGYAAHGTLQLILFPCLGVGWFWSVVDGILILSGGLKLDGYGRRLQD
jgi:TM2 domain-containing membrane protein YozV